MLPYIIGESYKNMMKSPIWVDLLRICEFSPFWKLILQGFFLVMFCKVQVFQEGTNFDKIFTVDLTLDGEDFVNFLALFY